MDLTFTANKFPVWVQTATTGWQARIYVLHGPLGIAGLVLYIRNNEGKLIECITFPEKEDAIRYGSDIMKLQLALKGVGA